MAMILSTIGAAHIANTDTLSSGMASYYELLGIAPDAELPDIKRAYRQLARQYHPDGGQHTDTDQFLLIAEAYQTLIDDNLRAAYDRQLRVEAARDAYNTARTQVAMQAAIQSRKELRPFYYMLIGFVFFFFLMLIALAFIMLEFGPERVRVAPEPNSMNTTIEIVDERYIC